MLRIDGHPLPMCDRQSRRAFLQIGGLALGGLSLPQILRAQSESGESQPHKAVIMVFLAGGAPHQDTVDMKPDAPSPQRGEFKPISTNVPGIQITELMPRVAAMIDKFSIIRSLVGSEGRHDSTECCTGRPFIGPLPQPPGGWPAMGSNLSHLLGPVDRGVPPYVDLSQDMYYKPWNIKGSGFLGSRHAPFRPEGRALENMKLNGVSLDRLSDRARLHRSLDRFRRDVDGRLATGGTDGFTEQALGVLTSPKLVEALDLERDDPSVRARYGVDESNLKLFPGKNKGYDALVSKLLLARRAVEAGARCVTCSFAHFDWHSNNFPRARWVLPRLDQALAALVEDLHERGLNKDVTVLVWGEFGRTPKVNGDGGRDHWPPVHSALLAGGGMRTGQVIGATDRMAENATERPIHMQEVFATVYHNLGIDVANDTVVDPNGRPHYLLEHRQPIRELV